MLIVHHLQRGQSERIVWLCEELGIPYDLKNYKRDPNTMLSPPELKALHPAQSAPVIQDGSVTLAESGAIVEYILTKYGNGKLAIPPSADNYADYLYFLHFTNGTLQPAILRCMLLQRLGADPSNKSAQIARGSFEKSLGIVEDRLSKFAWLAGNEFTAADIMIVFSLTTMRLFYQFDLEEYPAIRAYLEHVGQLEGYQKAMAKSDPEMKPFIGQEKPGSVLK